MNGECRIASGPRRFKKSLELQPDRRIILITDGLPTAHFQDSWLFMPYPPDPRTELHTLPEGLRCREMNITLNAFLLSSWSQTEQDVRFANRPAEQTTG